LAASISPLAAAAFLVALLPWHIVAPATTFRLNDDIREAMDTLKEHDGIPINTQANHAIRAYLEHRGVPKKKPAKK
jgi:hypothetical protein